ncbi:acetolactate synthase small subunit [Oceanobacillus sp. CFH 90083]|uniref:acetolactate synthase small subunit n=1 Tax=Oceanobacillus sp. CFH 90083 TaxID=2592336 RepID=UPI00128BD256|nr:acetolactate synthase small subunit [Oceanobacillus sp. CFH 90083]
MKRIIIATVQDHGGVLNRITGMLHRRQFNIESISVGASDIKGISKMTFVVDVNDKRRMEQLTKQLNKQIDVIKVLDVTEKAIVTRELALIKVVANNQTRAEIMTLISTFRADVIDISKESVTIQVTGKPEKVDALISLLRAYGIKDLTKTGLTAFPRGSQPEQAFNERTGIKTHG